MMVCISYHLFLSLFLSGYFSELCASFSATVEEKSFQQHMVVSHCASSVSVFVSVGEKMSVCENEGECVCMYVRERERPHE